MWKEQDDGVYIEDITASEPSVLAKMLMVFRQRFAGRDIAFHASAENAKMQRLVKLLKAVEVSRAYRLTLPGVNIMSKPGEDDLVKKLTPTGRAAYEKDKAFERRSDGPTPGVWQNTYNAMLNGYYKNR